MNPFSSRCCQRNYALQFADVTKDLKLVRKSWPADNFLFTTESVPIRIEAKGRKVPSWKMDKYGLCDVLPEESCIKEEILDNITLIPMKAARLRISAFPVSK